MNKQYCKQCGSMMEAGLRFCPACGAEQPAEPQQPTWQPEPQPAYEQTPSPGTQAVTWQPEPQPAQQPQAAWSQTPEPQQQPTQPDCSNQPQQNAWQPGPPQPPSRPQTDAEANKLWGILSYLWCLAVVTVFAAPKQSKFARFHANQGLVLFIVSTAMLVIREIFWLICSHGYNYQNYWLYYYDYSMSWLRYSVIFSVIGIAIVIFMIVFTLIGISNASNGRMKPLPLLGKINILKAAC